MKAAIICPVCARRTLFWWYPESDGQQEFGTVGVRCANRDCSAITKWVLTRSGATLKLPFEVRCPRRSATQV